MMPLSLQAQIYHSLPQQCVVDNAIIPAVIAWADTANIPLMLEAQPIAATLQLSADVRETAWTSPGMVESTTYDAETQQQILRQYRRVTFTASIHARDFDGIAAQDIINAYTSSLQIWAMSDLRDIVNVADDGGVADLSYLEEDTQRREYTLYLRYALDAVRTYDNIVDVDDPAIRIE